ncbi:MAG: AAA family ATPase [Candidatus Lokiarchaeota archaeon]|nr:AAA family ATPase [Candidatus Lokiarchaeota archaeon]
MIIKSIKVQNIRSIEHLQNLTLPESTVLFYGDIGSGKSSLLKAIEFALFGTMGDLAGKSLLRRGKDFGNVELEFLINDDRYRIWRGLRREVSKEGDETFSNVKGWIERNGTREEYTTTDLRIEMLKLLNYSVPRYKSHNKYCIDIFRYTVYTPQEKLKEIISAKADERFEILKDVLEIERYEQTIANVEKIKTQLNRDLRQKEKEIDKLGNPQKEIKDLEEKQSELKEELKNFRKDLETQTQELRREKQKVQKLQAKLPKYAGDFATLQAHHKSIQDSEEALIKHQEKIKNAESDITNLENEIEQLPEIKVPEHTSEEDIKKEINRLEGQNKKLNEVIAVQKTEKTKIENILEKGKCDTCGQEVHEKERFDNELEEINSDLKQNFERIAEIEKNLVDQKDLLEKIRKAKEIKKDKDNLQNNIKTKQEIIQDSSEEVGEHKKNIDKKHEEIQTILDTYKTESVETFEKVKQDLENKVIAQKDQVESVQSILTEIDKAISRIESSLDIFSDQISELQTKVEKKKELEKETIYMTAVRDWVDDHLPQLMRDIERAILQTTAREFNQFFKEWFRAMVEDSNIEISINPERFEPEVYIDGYNSPFEDLSGGEKSALSLSYRLALNKTITEKHPEIKTRDLLILDEPTDGFSQEQVKKMQDIFEKLDTRQMIIISHERSLDSFVSHIFNFTKENHKTQIRAE